MAVSDIVTDGPLPDSVKSSLSAWAGCVAGALDVHDYERALKAAGFTRIEVSPTYFDDAIIEEAMRDLSQDAALKDMPRDKVAKTVFSARITAYKP